MVEIGRDHPRPSDFTGIPREAGKPAAEKNELCWLDIQRLTDKLKVPQITREESISKIEAPKGAPSNLLDPSSYNVDRAAEVVEGLQHRFDGSLFPKFKDTCLAQYCEQLQKDMKAWSKEVKESGLGKEQCKKGVDIYLRLAGLMMDPKVTPVAGGKGPADYNYARALELAQASEDPNLYLMVAGNYAQFLRANFTDKGSLTKAATLEAYVRKNSR